MSPRPVVSVIVPCYNYGEFLAECVHSVIDQSGVDTEVLIIDDASTDDSWHVAECLAARHDNVQALRHLENHGHISTYNEGLAWASGDYIVLLSADDLLVNGALGRAVSVMERHPNVGLAYGRARGFHGEPPSYPAASTAPSIQITNGRLWFERVCQDGENPIAAPEAVVRASVHRQAGGYDRSLPHSADLELWLRLALSCDVARIYGEHALKRTHGRSMQDIQFFDPLARLQQREEAFMVAIDRYRERFDDHERLLSMTRQAQARDALWSIASTVRRRTATSAKSRALVAYARSMQLAPAARARGSLLGGAMSRLWLARVFIGGTARWSNGWVKARRKARQERQRLAGQRTHHKAA